MKNTLDRKTISVGLTALFLGAAAVTYMDMPETINQIDGVIYPVATGLATRMLADIGGIVGMLITGAAYAAVFGIVEDESEPCSGRDRAVVFGAVAGAAGGVYLGYDFVKDVTFDLLVKDDNKSAYMIEAPKRDAQIALGNSEVRYDSKENILYVPSFG